MKSNDRTLSQRIDIVRQHLLDGYTDQAVSEMAGVIINDVRTVKMSVRHLLPEYRRKKAPRISRWQIITLVLMGLNTREMANHFGISEPSMRRFIDTHHLRLVNHNREMKALRGYARSGMTFAMVAEEMCLDEFAIRGWAMRHNVRFANKRRRRRPSRVTIARNPDV